MAQNNGMPVFDLDSIVESELGTQEPNGQPNSDGQPNVSQEPPAPPAPGGNGNVTHGDTPDGQQDLDPEAGSDDPQAGQPNGEPPQGNQRPFTRLQKAEYSATKWKKRARKLAEERDKLAAEFDRYKSLNPAVFRNPQERADFMAWRAATQQRLNDMETDLRDYADQEAADVFDEKVQQCYSTPENQRAYSQLESHYGDAFAYACSQVDPDNIIQDYLKDSPYEPAMRNVIYKNGELQEQLFRQYRNPTIGNQVRQQILQNLEAQVKAFYANQAKAAKTVKTQPQVPNAGGGTPANGTQQRTPKYQLPPRPASAQTATPVAQRPVPQVTGALTRGNEGGAEPSDSAAADRLFNQIYGAGAT